VTTLGSGTAQVRAVRPEQTRSYTLLKIGGAIVLVVLIALLSFQMGRLQSAGQGFPALPPTTAAPLAPPALLAPPPPKLPTTTPTQVSSPTAVADGGTHAADDPDSHDKPKPKRKRHAKKKTSDGENSESPAVAPVTDEPSP
jgi:hypothetical protein